MSPLQSTSRQSRLATFLQWLVSKLPPRLKRIVFTGMLLGYFDEKKDPDLELIKKINDTFKAASSVHAYELPFAVKSILWKDFDINSLNLQTTEINGVRRLTLSSKSDICSHIVSTLPEWIRYASPSRIYKDTLFILNEVENRKLQTTTA